MPTCRARRSLPRVIFSTVTRPFCSGASAHRLQVALTLGVHTRRFTSPLDEKMDAFLLLSCVFFCSSVFVFCVQMCFFLSLILSFPVLRVLVLVTFVFSYLFLPFLARSYHVLLFHTLLPSYPLLPSSTSFSHLRTFAPLPPFPPCPPTLPPTFQASRFSALLPFYLSIFRPYHLPTSYLYTCLPLYCSTFHSFCLYTSLHSYPVNTSSCFRTSLLSSPLFDLRSPFLTLSFSNFFSHDHFFFWVSSVCCSYFLTRFAFCRSNFLTFLRPDFLAPSLSYILTFLHVFIVAPFVSYFITVLRLCFLVFKASTAWFDE